MGLSCNSSVESTKYSILAPSLSLQLHFPNRCPRLPFKLTFAMASRESNYTWAEFVVNPGAGSALARHISLVPSDHRPSQLSHAGLLTFLRRCDHKTRSRLCRARIIF